MQQGHAASNRSEAQTSAVGGHKHQQQEGMQCSGGHREQQQRRQGKKQQETGAAMEGCTEQGGAESNSCGGHSMQLGRGACSSGGPWPLLVRSLAP